MFANPLNVNPALYETAVAFDPQLSMGGFRPDSPITVPTAIEFKDGKAHIRFHAPNAKQAAIRLGWSEGARVEMEKKGDIWETALDINHPGYCALFFEIDGTYVLNPMAPIGWSQSHPINFIDFPSAGTEYYHLNDVPHGTVARDYYFSKTCGCWKSCLVYTPPGYARGEGENLPVLYLQHGYGENETSWVHLGKVNFIMDNLLAAGKAKPCIIVMNNGMVQSQQDDYSREWSPMTIERLLLDDCIPHIESHYRVATDKWSRAMAGLSMGSMQTSVCTLKNPDVFGYAGIFSGFLGMVGPRRDLIKNEHFALLDDKPKLLDAFRLFFRCMGDTDQYFNTYKEEGEMLSAKGLAPGQWPAHTEKIYPGGHDWNVWRPCVRDFLTMIF